MNEPQSLTYSSSRGVSFVEMLIVSAVLTFIAGGIFLLLSQSQRSYQSQQDLTNVVQQARIAMDQVTTYLRQAGNDPQNSLGSTPPIEILGTGHIRINSDISGSVSAANPLDATGDPDGVLTARAERVVVRYDSSAQDLYLDIGDGEEVLAENISTFSVTFYDLAGNTTATESDITRARIKLVGETADADPQTGKVQTITLESDVMLRSKSYDVFSW